MCNIQLSAIYLATVFCTETKDCTECVGDGSVLTIGYWLAAHMTSYDITLCLVVVRRVPLVLPVMEAWKVDDFERIQIWIEAVECSKKSLRSNYYCATCIQSWNSEQKHLPRCSQLEPACSQPIMLWHNRWCMTFNLFELCHDWIGCLHCKRSTKSDCL